MVYFDVLFSQYQRYVGIRRNEVDRSHNSRWIISTDESMPSLPPCDAAAPVHGTHVRAIGTSITITDISRPRH